MILNPDQYRLSEDEHQAIFENDIKPELFRHAQSVSQPVAVIFGGQPGAGKSAAIDVAMAELAQQGGAVEIIGDDLRDYHPAYEPLMRQDDKTGAFYTDRDTGRWVEKAIAEAKAQRVNLVIEGTMRDGDKVAATMQSLREAGYTIDARALAVTAKLSEQGIMLRYEGQKADRGNGRMTMPEAHKAGYDGMLKTLERIETEKQADSVTVYRRGAEVLYSNTLKGGNWERAPNARAIVEAERARPMTLQERKDYLAGFDKLAGLLTRPERQASTQEVRHIEGLRQQAKVSLAAEVFRQETPEKAAQQFPELQPALNVMKQAAQHFETKMPGDTKGQRQAMAHVRQHVQAKLDQCETQYFRQADQAQQPHEPAREVRTAQRSWRDPEPDTEPDTELEH